jgi:hypothetical protein
MLRGMIFATAIFAAATGFVTVTATAMAQSNDGKPIVVAQQGGTPQEDAACRRDTRRFCRHIKAGAGNNAFLQCLQEHRARLSKPCDAVLKSHGL